MKQKRQCPERASVKRGRGGAGRGGFKLLLVRLEEVGGMALLACMMGTTEGFSSLPYRCNIVEYLTS